MRLPDWIVVAQEEWDVIERRNQLVIRALANRDPRARFLFVERPLRLRQICRWRRPRPRQVARNVWSLRPIRVVPDGVSARLSDRVEAAQIRHAARCIGLESPFLWTQDPRAATLVDLLPVGSTIYDLTDDWAAFEVDPERRQHVQERIESLGHRAAMIFACSRTLEQGARRWSDRVRFLPNAVDPPADERATPADLARIARPRLGYAGTLHSSRLDVTLLSRAAELRPAWSFVLLGPDLLKPADRSRLFALPNVHYIGARPHSEVRAYLEGLDICLLIHRVTEFTRSLDPLKVYEYLAAGRPIISTPVGNAPELAPFILSAATAEQLVERAEETLDVDDPAVAAKRRARVAGETWDARAKEIERALNVDLRRERTDEVSVVIVSFNTRGLLARCLNALDSQDDVTRQVIVVDNGSIDGSVELVRDTFPHVELIELDENVGFARANNLAFARCRGRHVLLLNSDAFLSQGALSALLACSRRHPSAGAIGPRLSNPDGTLQRSAWPFPSGARLLLEAFGLHRPLRRVGLLEDFGIWRHDCERAVDFLVGACLLVRWDALSEVGGFDEDFWLYGEEADLQRRMATRGWEVIFTPDAGVTHVGSASSAQSSTRLRQFYSGQRRFLQKHGGRSSWLVARVALLTGSLLRGRIRAAQLAIKL
jgi:GT2 family glycosyltransferase/glycosyltransferase involved in cell wall biosynthesis